MKSATPLEIEQAITLRNLVVDAVNRNKKALTSAKKEGRITERLPWKRVLSYNQVSFLALVRYLNKHGFKWPQ